MSKYEDQIVCILRAASVKFEREKRFSDLCQGRYRFDFYLPIQHILIEVDGQLHWKPIRGRAALLKQQEHDRRKNSYCLARNIPLYRIPYWDINKISKIDDIFKTKYLVTSKWWNDFLKAPK